MVKPEDNQLRMPEPEEPDCVTERRALAVPVNSLQETAVATDDLGDTAILLVVPGDDLFGFVEIGHARTVGVATDISRCCRATHVGRE
ncbi:hypothetical protein AADG42_14775 [Ammonicoccus fulvus]|uniref:Uncharacterized protein n=1 Tax=Ammonicoccus fulvus TaxID=3138240 RepID=A0ABZ3FQY3_9ACTN